MIVITCLTALLLTLSNFEQQVINWLKAPVSTNYTCVNDSLFGSLVYPGSREGMEHFYSQLDKMLEEEGTVNILHIGGSHVQAGDFSGQMRSNFSRWGENTIGDRGVIFPFKVLKSNGPYNYYVSYSGKWGKSRCVSSEPDVALGLSGAAAIAQDANDSITFDFRGDLRWAFSRIRVIGESSSPDVYPIIISDADTICVFEKDEQNEGYIFDLGAEKTKFQIAFKGVSENKNFILRGILPLSSREGITYSESGVNGAAVPSWLRCQKFTQDLSLLPPNLVIFGIGINDANVPENEFDAEVFKADYRSLIRQIQSINPQCSFLFITNNDCYLNLPRRKRRGKKKTFNKNTEKVQMAFYDLAKEYNSCVIDVYALMGGYGSSEKWCKENLMKKDHIHFTQEGYRLIGDILYNAIVEDYFITRNAGTTL